MQVHVNFRVESITSGQEVTEEIYKRNSGILTNQTLGERFDDSSKNYVRFIGSEYRLHKFAHIVGKNRPRLFLP